MQSKLFVNLIVYKQLQVEIIELEIMSRSKYNEIQTRLISISEENENNKKSKWINK